jgi:hypoxanthine phosphoribosyltransferase
VIRRAFDHEVVWCMTMRQARAASLLLADAAAARGPIACVVGIARGGLLPAALIAERLDVALHVAHARHNQSDDLHVQATGAVSCQLDDTKTSHGTVLVVDDICGTGASLAAVKDALIAQGAAANRIIFAALCRNAASEHQAGSWASPHLWIWGGLRDWVRFPWEAPIASGTTTKVLPDPDRAWPA